MRVYKEHLDKNLLIVVGIILAMILAVMVMIISNLNKPIEEQPEVFAVNLSASEVAMNDAIDNSENQDVTLNDADTLDNDQFILDSFTVDLSDMNVPEGRDYYKVFMDELDKLKAADPEIVQKYFGNSDVFTPELVADRVSATTISFISNVVSTDGNVEVNIHVCTIDYNKMNSDFNQFKDEALLNEYVDNEEAAIDTAKRSVAEKLIEGEYKVCYNIPIVIQDGSIVPKEYLKQALTGGWYKGLNVELEPVDCIVE